MQFSWQHHGQPCSMKRFLTDHGISMRLIKAVKHGEGHFIVNEKERTGAITINAGDVAGIWLPDEAGDPDVAVSQQPLAVVFEDANWLVVDKPAGLTSVPGPSNATDTLVNRVKGYLVAQQATNLKPHLLTRLDRDTSGLVLVAKNRVAQGMLADGHGIEKTYWAWIEGTLTPTHGTIDQPIGRVADQPRRVVTPNGQRAVTRYRVLATAHGVSRIELKLVTGRTHQIRVHLAAMGHPLIGDALYGGNERRLGRQALHAVALTFTDPLTGKRHSCQAAVPADIARARQAGWPVE